ncbi:hypothetical protein DDE18_15765 [Nocardioides gansuensis]|uniref:Lsr2 family protein n=1 Tax=Nocardioides gansuensis TaxID=2138300 RepID=A0A2T8F8S7_9ACTN|nr:Lsr2 family protein [Nocardioides gansuensis]PVG82131.1 hypothetical protein DDE18_15765 [Nocardioides gansuensis]
MAKTTITQITDDLDGSKDAQEVSFSYQGTDYTIDLGKKNMAAFEKALKPYISAATKVSKRAARSGRSAKPRTANQNLAAVRAWAKSAGLEVSDRGRIPKSVLAQYEAAQRSS